jgi:GT2 family glycosyltransferase
MNKILFTITTYNQLKYTKLCVDSLLKIEDFKVDIVGIDDGSTDGTAKWLRNNDISVVLKKEGRGLTDSWNIAYKHFKDNKEYKYVIISNNDVLVPPGAIKEMVEVFEKWPFSLVVPMSSVAGAGHNGNVQGVETIYPQVSSDWLNDSYNYQEVQKSILTVKNLYMLDPVRMKMFNGFFFMMNRNIINYERKDGLLFNPEKLMYQGEDDFNWSTLIPNNDFPALCKTAFIFHFKGMSTKGFSIIKNDKKKWLKLRNKGE